MNNLATILIAVLICILVYWVIVDRFGWSSWIVVIFGAVLITISLIHRVKG